MTPIISLVQAQGNTRAKSNAYCTATRIRFAQSLRGCLATHADSLSSSRQ
jgi:hypothetical protein